MLCHTYIPTIAERIAAESSPLRPGEIVIDHRGRFKVAGDAGEVVTTFNPTRLSGASFRTLTGLGREGSAALAAIVDEVRSAVESGVNHDAIRRKMSQRTAAVLKGSADPLIGDDAGIFTGFLSEVVELVVADAKPRTQVA